MPPHLDELNFCIQSISLQKVRLGVEKTVSRAERARFRFEEEESEARIRAGVPRWGNPACF